MNILSRLLKEVTDRKLRPQRTSC